MLQFRQASFLRSSYSTVSFSKKDRRSLIQVAWQGFQNGGVKSFSGKHFTVGENIIDDQTGLIQFEIEILASDISLIRLWFCRFYIEASDEFGIGCKMKNKNWKK